MSNLSVYTQSSILKWVAGSENMPVTQQPYCALYSGDPFGFGNEITDNITGSANGRVAISFGAVSSYASGHEITNGAVVDFGSSQETTKKSASYIAIYDNQTVGSGEIIVAGQLSSNKEIEQNDIVQFPIGTLTVRLQGDT